MFMARPRAVLDSLIYAIFTSLIVVIISRLQGRIFDMISLSVFFIRESVVCHLYK